MRIKQTTKGLLLLALLVTSVLGIAQQSSELLPSLEYVQREVSFARAEKSESEMDAFLREVQCTDPDVAAALLEDFAARNGLSLDTPLYSSRGQPPERFEIHGVSVEIGDGLSDNLAALVAITDLDNYIPILLQLSSEPTLGDTIELYRQGGRGLLNRVAAATLVVAFPARSIPALGKMERFKAAEHYALQLKLAMEYEFLREAIVIPIDCAKPEYELAMRALGIRVKFYDSDINFYFVDMSRSEGDALLQEWWVKEVSFLRLSELESVSDAEVPDVCMAQDSRELCTAFPIWYYVTGVGITLGVKDGAPFSTHADLSGAFASGSDTGSSEHGTHVSGIIAARNSSTYNISGTYDAQGIACGARLYVADDPYATAFSRFESNNIAVSNNSWGWSGDYGYNTHTEILDGYADNKGMTIIKSAGNEGPSSSTITNPGTGKNILAVGAIRYLCDNDRTDRGFGGVAQYSSRGPILGRLRPDLVAPGGQTYSDYWYYKYGVVSLDNSASGDSSSDAWPENSHYLRKSGTSMAAPHVTGVVGLMLDVAQDNSYTLDSEDIKAMLIATTIPLDEGGSSASSGYASNSVGYGLVNAFNAARYRYSGESACLRWGTGYVDWLDQVDSWTFTVPTGTKRLIAVLAYNDNEGDEGNLHDDVDLELVKPSGYTYYHSLASGVTQESPIEKVIVENPTSGTWTVRGRLISPGVLNSQDFTIYVYALYKKPALSVSATRSPSGDLAVGQAFEVTVTVTNTGGWIAAGATAKVSGSGFGGQNGWTLYVGNLNYQNASDSRTFELTAPTSGGWHTLSIVADGLNRSLSSVSTSMNIYVEPSDTTLLPGDYVQTTDYLYMRTGPGTGYDPITLLSPGSVGLVLPHANNGVYADGHYWWHVYFDCQEGWSSSHRLERTGTYSVGQGAPDSGLFTDAYTRVVTDEGTCGYNLFGYAINSVHSWGNGLIQDFRKNSNELAIMKPNGRNEAYGIYGAIWAKYQSLGSPPSFLGYPTSDEREALPSGAWGFSTAGRVQNFEGGHIHWHRDGPHAGQALETHGAIDNKYLDYNAPGISGSAGWLGFPISDEYTDPSTGYARSDFEGGYITTLNGISFEAFSYSAEDTNPPNPDPMTWADDPDATSTTSMEMIATSAIDPEGSSVSYCFEEKTGAPGGSDSCWQTTPTYADTGLHSNTRYCYTVKAQDDNNNETGESSQGCRFTYIEKPTGIVFGDVTSTSIEAKSQNTPSNLTLAGSGLSIMDDKGHSSGWKRNNNWWVNDGLSPNTEYNFSAVAKNGDGIETDRTTNPKYTHANTPAAPSVESTTTDSLDVVVNPNGNPSPTQFAIRDVTRGCWVQPNGSCGGTEAWQTASEWGVLVTGLNPDTTYGFRVKAKNGNGVETALGDEAQGTTSSGPPEPPTGITASDGTYGDFIRIAWSSVPNALRYKVYRAPDPGACSNDFTEVADVGVTSYDDSKPEPLAVHWYRVKACNTDCSDFSEIDTGYRNGTPPDETTAVFRVDASGNVYTDEGFYGSSFCTQAADVAEWVSVSEPVEPGDVLELDPDNPGYCRKSQIACSSLVAGVVSTDPGFILGSRPATVDSGLSTPDRTLLALIGIVPVKVTDEGGPIQPGDLLVSSSTPGYAMWWEPNAGSRCNLIGKALEPLEEESGIILVLLTAH